MNFATVLQFDSISQPAWAEYAIRHTRQAAVQSQIILKAFSKTIAPVIAITAKDLGHYYMLCGQGAGQWAMNAAGVTHNPIQAAVRAAYAELSSDASFTTYRRIGHIIRETAMDSPGCGSVWSRQQSQSVLMSFRKAIAQQPSFIAPSTVA